MTRSRPFTWIASAILALVAIAHIIRLVLHWPVIIGHCNIPQWVSVAGAIIAGFLSWMLCREARGTTGP